MGHLRHSEDQNGHQPDAVRGMEVHLEEDDHRQRREHVLDHARQHQTLAVDNRYNDQHSVDHEPEVSCVS